jgi:hypothetical protein
VVCEVSTLDHELLDDAVECRALVTEALLAGSKSTTDVSNNILRIDAESSYRKFSAVLGTVLP